MCAGNHVRLLKKYGEGSLLAVKSTSPGRRWPSRRIVSSFDMTAISMCSSSLKKNVCLFGVRVCTPAISRSRPDLAPCHLAGGRLIFVREDREESGGSNVIGGGLPAP